jgi:SPP1 gp7 family putative phage head morphogenesis protein
MITHSRFQEIRLKLFGRKLALRPKPPNEPERLYLGAARIYADSFRQIVGGAIAETYPELLDPKNVRTDGLWTGWGPLLSKLGRTHLDARVGPLMLGKRANKILKGITNPLKAAAERIPLEQVAGTVRKHVERDVQRYMPGLKNTDLFLGSQIAEWRRTNVGLISSMTDEMLEKIGNLLEDYDGTRVEDVATSLEDTFGLTRARAELIARDQVLKLNADLNQQAQTNAGVDKYRWSTSKDGSVRDDPKDRGDPNHAILEGTKHSWDDPPVTCERTGATNHPGQDYQCRCVAIPVLEEFDDAVQAEDED